MRPRLDLLLHQLAAARRAGGLDHRDRRRRPTVERKTQQFWGLRGSNDAILRRCDTDLDGDYDATDEANGGGAFYQLTDSLFSVIAHVRASDGVVVCRFSYDSYGALRVHLPGDFNGDGVVNASDLENTTSPLTAFTGAYEAGLPSADYNGDGVVDSKDEDAFVADYNAASELPSFYGPSVLRIGYCGYVRDFVFTGRWLSRNRWYDSDLGRWVTRDPSGYTDGLNVYLYVHCNPFSLVDPSGLDILGIGGFFCDCYDGAVEAGTILCTRGGNLERDANAQQKLESQSQKNAGVIAKNRAAAGDTQGAMDTLTTNGQQSDDAMNATAKNVVTRAELTKEFIDGTVRTVLPKVGDYIMDKFDELDHALDPHAQDLDSDAPRGAGAMIAGVGNMVRNFAKSRAGGAGKPGETCNGESTCFVAGTVVATANGSRAIDAIHVGERVATPGTNEAGETKVDPTTWRQFSLALVDGVSGVETQVELLRPADWFVGVSVGDRVRLAFYDIGLVGEATVLKVGPCPTVEAGPGRVVLTTMSHKAGNVLDLKLAGLHQAIGVTDTHRIFSEDRGMFVPAGELTPGERVRTQDGWAVIESINRHRQGEEVYNLEVEADHVYFASTLAVLVHNDCPAAAGDAERVSEQRKLRNTRRETESRLGKNGGKGAAEGVEGNGQNLQGSNTERYQGKLDGKKGPSGTRPVGPSGSDRQRNIGIDEEHSRVAKGTGGGQGRR